MKTKNKIKTVKKMNLEASFDTLHIIFAKPKRKKSGKKCVTIDLEAVFGNAFVK
jgi:hypothetical protein